MKKLLLLLLCVPLIGVGQINVGVDQTICLGDTAEVIVLLQGGGQGAGMDTVIIYDDGTVERKIIVE